MHCNIFQSLFQPVEKNLERSSGQLANQQTGPCDHKLNLKDNAYGPTASVDIYFFSLTQNMELLSFDIA
jgi:hypothetical protein